MWADSVLDTPFAVGLEMRQKASGGQRWTRKQRAAWSPAGAGPWVYPSMLDASRAMEIRGKGSGTTRDRGEDKARTMHLQTIAKTRVSSTFGPKQVHARRFWIASGLSCK
jgi:hypothetical protein